MNHWLQRYRTAGLQGCIVARGIPVEEYSVSRLQGCRESTTPRPWWVYPRTRKPIFIIREAEKNFSKFRVAVCLERCALFMSSASR
jgi:hypothetical protein